MPNQPEALSRPRTTYTIPEASRVFPTDPHRVTLVSLTLREEKLAQRRADVDGSITTLTYELVRQSVVAVDDQEVDWSNASTHWLDQTSRPVRELLLEAYSAVNRPRDEDAKAFLASASTVVGP
jgi:hypothetical protein